MLLLVENFIRLQYASKLSATLVANNVVAFRDNPVKNSVEFNGTCA